MDSSHKYLILKIVDTMDQTLKVLIKRTTPMRRLKIMFAKKRFIAVNAFKFYFDGKRISDRDTPQSLDMVTGDVIEVYLDQNGGVVEFVV